MLRLSAICRSMHDVEVREGRTILVELVDQTGPFASELVGTRQTSITTTNGQAVDTERDQVLSRLQSSFSSSDFGHRRSVFCAREPGWRKSAQEGHRDDPIRVPPSPSHPRTSSHPTRTIYLPFKLFPSPLRSVANSSCFSPAPNCANSSRSPSPAPYRKSSPYPNDRGASDSGAT